MIFYGSGLLEAFLDSKFYALTTVLDSFSCFPFLSSLRSFWAPNLKCMSISFWVYMGFVLIPVDDLREVGFVVLASIVELTLAGMLFGVGWNKTEYCYADS